MSRKVKIILTVSVILNFFLIGLIIGQYSGQFYMYKHFRDNINEASKKLSPDKEKLLKKTMRNLHRETRDTRKKIKKTRKELYRIITAPTFNENSYDEKVKELHDLHSQMASELSETAKELAVEFNQEEREVIAEILKKGHRGKPGLKHRSQMPH